MIPDPDHKSVELQSIRDNLWHLKLQIDEIRIQMISIGNEIQKLKAPGDERDQSYSV